MPTTGDVRANHLMLGLWTTNTPCGEITCPKCQLSVTLENSKTCSYCGNQYHIPCGTKISCAGNISSGLMKLLKDGILTKSKPIGIETMDFVTKRESWSAGEEDWTYQSSCED